MSLPATVRLLKPPARLPALVARPGGMTRDAAIARAEQRLEAQRGPAMKVIGIFITTLEAMVTPPLMPAQLTEISRVTDRLIALAEIYALDGLAEAGKRLCDLAATFTEARAIHTASLAVHVRALRLMAMDQPPDGVLAELDKVLAHFGAQRLDQ
jgi:hypothetical protein